MAKNVAVFVIALVLMGSVVAGIYYNLIPFPFRGSTFSLSQIIIDPEGNIEGNKVKGTYWILNTVVDKADKYVGIIDDLENGTSRNYKGETAYSARDLVIKITPKQAYFMRAIQRQQIEITSKAYQTQRNSVSGAISANKGADDASSLVQEAWTYSEDFWHHKSVFTVEVWLNNEKIGNTITLNTGMGDDLFVIDTDYGAITISNLGALSSGLSDPDAPYMFFTDDYVYREDQVWEHLSYDKGLIQKDWRTSVEGKVQVLEGQGDPYSLYWYGWMRWTENNNVEGYDADLKRTPVGVKKPKIGEYVLFLLSDSAYGGWMTSTSGNNKRTPVKPVFFPSQKNQLPTSKRSFYCVSEWIEAVQHIENKGKSGKNSAFNPYKDWVLASDYVRVNVPFTAYQKQMLQIKVPVEMVDTWVYRPQIADLRVEDVGWMDTDSNNIDIHSELSKSFWVKVKQYADVTATGRVKVSSSQEKASVEPAYEDIMLASGETTVVDFTVTNLGVDGDTDGRITVECIELEMGQNTGPINNDLTFTLKKQGGTGDTVLDVYVSSDETEERIEGVEVRLNAGGEITEYWTNDFGYASFNLGTYIGKVDIKAKKEGYEDYYHTKNVASGTNEITIKLVTEGGEPELPWEMILIVVVVICVMIAIFAIIMSKKGKKGGRKR